MPLPMMPTKQWELVRMMPPEVLDAAAQGKYLNQGISPVFALARIEEEGALKAAFQAEEQKRMQEEQAKMQGLPPGSPILDQRLSARGVDSSGITGADPSAGQEVPPDRMEQLQGGIAGGSPDEMMAGTPMDEMMAAGGLIPGYQTGQQVVDPYTRQRQRLEEQQRLEAEEVREQGARDLWAQYATLNPSIRPSFEEYQAMSEVERSALGTPEVERPSLYENTDPTAQDIIEFAQEEGVTPEEAYNAFYSEEFLPTTGYAPEGLKEEVLEDYVDPSAVPPGLGSENFPPGLQEAIDAGAIHPGVTSIGEGPSPPQEVPDLSDILPESAFSGDILQKYHQAAIDKRERAGEYSEEEQYRDYLREEELKDQLMDVRWSWFFFLYVPG